MSSRRRTYDLLQQLGNSLGGVRPDNGGFYDYQGRVENQFPPDRSDEVERLENKAQRLEKEKLDLVGQLNLALNAKTEIEREHMEVIVDLVKERKRQKSEDKQEDPLGLQDVL